jgi:molybdopterin/thiamine biosynthesis adenylyltransferase
LCILDFATNTLFGINSRASVAYFDRDSDISSFDVIFDCVDNFESRIVLSEKCTDLDKILISGGTSSDAGQIVVYNPDSGDVSPARLLGMYDLIQKRNHESYQRQKAACTLQADPSVIMTNQITAGFMVDSYRMLLEGQDPENIFYNSTSSARF